MKTVFRFKNFQIVYNKNVQCVFIFYSVDILLSNNKILFHNIVIFPIARDNVVRKSDLEIIVDKVSSRA